MFTLATPAAGTHTLVANYAAQGAFAAGSVTGPLLVGQATPIITWATPAPISYGTALSGTQLNATASVPGAFVHAPPAGTIFNAGSQILSTTFTPTDTVNYTTASATVTLTVNAAALTITANNAMRPVGAPNPAFTATGLVSSTATHLLR